MDSNRLHVIMYRSVASSVGAQEEKHTGNDRQQRKGNEGADVWGTGEGGGRSRGRGQLEEWARMRDGGKDGGQLSIGKMRADQWPSQWDLETLKALTAPCSVPKSH